MKLHHIALGARDVARLAEFYSAAFALENLDRHYTDNGDLRSVWLDIGSAVLMIEKTKDPLRRVEGVGAGPFLLAFEVDADEHHRVRARLAERGVAVAEETDFTSYFRDPEGNRVAISHYPIDASVDGLSDG